MLAVVDGGVARGAAMLAVVIAVQVFEGNVLQPWIQGRACPPSTRSSSRSSVVAGGALAGFLGVFLAVPVTARRSSSCSMNSARQASSASR